MLGSWGTNKGSVLKTYPPNLKAFLYCNLKFSGSDEKDMAEIVHVLYDEASAESYSTWTISAISFESDPENFKLQNVQYNANMFSPCSLGNITALILFIKLGA